jgi:hypothetical protein
MMVEECRLFNVQGSNLADEKHRESSRISTNQTESEGSISHRRNNNKTQ